MANRRPTDPGVARILMRAARRDEALWRKRTSDRTVTLMMGVSSLSLGSVLTIVMVAGLFGKSFGPLSAPRKLWINTTAQGTIDRWLLLHDEVSRTLVQAGEVSTMSPECYVLALVGLILGVIGIILAKDSAAFSWSSVLGIVLILLTLLSNAILGDFLRLSP